MSRIILVLGGARSGKSTYAEEKVEEIGRQIGYIATAKVTDLDMAVRIKHHQASRPSSWATIEQYKGFDQLKANKDFQRCDTFILDCVTILLTNQMFDYQVDFDTCDQKVIGQIEKEMTEEIQQLLDLMVLENKNLILVSNEVGLGLVPEYRLGNLFRDIAGRINQMLAHQADEAYFIVSGLPLTLK